MVSNINSKEKAELSSALAESRLAVLAGFKDAPIVEIPEIPTKMSLFPSIPNSKWKLIITTKEENKTSCLFILGAKQIFNTHKHKVSSELITILTKKADIEWVDETGIYKKTYKDKFGCPKGMKHALVNHSNFPVKFRVDWSPTMNGWLAIFS